MRLDEIKIALIEQFFSKQSIGINKDSIDPIFVELGKTLDEDLSEICDDLIVEAQGSSADPSKAFKRFTEGRKALLSICEEDGFKTYVIFAAVRIGKNVVYEDLTVENRSSKKGDLTTIKNAIRQAKNLNDEVYFVINNSKE